MPKSFLAQASTRPKEAHAKMCLDEVAKKLRDPDYPLQISDDLLLKIRKALAEWKRSAA